MFSMDAKDVFRLFQIAIYVYIFCSLPYLFYLIGTFLELYQLVSPIVIFCIQFFSCLIAFFLLFRFYSAWTMKNSIKKILIGDMTLNELFTVKSAKRRLRKVLFHTLCTLFIYIYTARQITLPILTAGEKFLLWGMLLSWIAGGFLFGYHLFFIERGRLAQSGMIK